MKSNTKYYDDAAILLREFILKKLAPTKIKENEKILADFEEKTKHIKVAENEILPKNHKELRCVLSVFRHGDRTPKQKLKMVYIYIYI